MKIVKFILSTILLATICHCGKDSIVTIEDPAPIDYTKIYTAESGSVKFEVYSKTFTNFVYGYNELGFKAYLNGAEQNQGFVKFKPTMYHGIGGPSHSIPVPEKYFFDQDKQLYTGYAIFIMYDTSAFWAADFSFDNNYSADSLVIPLLYSSKTKIISWINSVTEKTYFITMLAPTAPVVGLNDLDLMLHYTTDMSNFTEINDGEMFIRPWMESMGHGSSNNVDPVYVAPGRYKGVVNFNMPGEWYLYDSIKVGGNFITLTPAPKFILEVN